jgi:uncharacterized protein
MEKECKGPTRIVSKNSGVVIDELMDLFAEVDRKVEELKVLTGVHCPDMCGICCSSIKVETTAIEMMPLAEELWRINEADVWLDKINSASRPLSCVFFKNDTGVPGNGRCSVYSLRPLICRLFGFFTIKDKNGKYDYGSCKVINDKYPENYKKAVKMVKEGNHPSNVTDYSIRIISMGTGISSKMVPINVAAKIAIEKIGFEANFK